MIMSRSADDALRAMMYRAGVLRTATGRECHPNQFPFQAQKNAFESQ